jgi:hypothetical protein
MDSSMVPRVTYEQVFSRKLEILRILLNQT